MSIKMSILTKFKNLTIESLKENKKLIIVLYIIFILVFITTWIISSPIMEDNINNISSANTTTNTAIDTTEIFIINEWGGIITYITLIFFAIPAIIMLLYNAANLGVLGPYFNLITPNGSIKYLIYLIPHGIFEITATVIQSAAGILLFLFIVKFIKALINKEIHGIKEAFKNSKKALIQSLILMIFATILLIIAAPIEAYLSVPFSEFIVGT